MACPRIVKRKHCLAYEVVYVIADWNKIDFYCFASPRIPNKLEFQ
jgi:hypothetical protein